jgi:hypothetical protein
MSYHHHLAFIIGLLIVFGSHFYILLGGKHLVTLESHCYLNIFGSLLMAYSIIVQNIIYNYSNYVSEYEILVKGNY